MSNPRPIDEISKLHGLTMSFGRQVQDIIGKSFIACTKLDNYDELSDNPIVQSVAFLFPIPLIDR